MLSCTFSFGVVASLIALTIASHPEGLRPRKDDGHVGCSIPHSPPGSTRCYTQIASTRGPSHYNTEWNTQWTPCTLTAVCKTTTTITPTRTFTSTVTTTTSVTYTAPAPATFTPVQSSLQGSTYDGTGGSDPIDKRGHSNLGIQLRSQPEMRLVLKKSYPQRAVCREWAYDSCHTTSTTVTATVTKRRSTKVTTVTTTSTSTTTVTTLYAACATNNLADSYMSTPFGEVTGGFSSVYDTNATDAYDCCVAAITLSDTSVWAYEPNPFGGEGANCFIGQTDGTCPAPASNPSTAESGFGDLVVGNAYCGEISADVPIAASKRAEPTQRVKQI